MNRSLITLLSLGFLSLTAVVSCGSDDEKDPYATADDFCAAWSERACVTTVVENCSDDEPSKATCRKAQKKFCLNLLGDRNYRRAPVEQCLEYVERAYDDAKIDAVEAAVVLRLGAPCAQVIGKGGKLCEADKDCDDDGECEETAAGVGVCRIGGGRACDPGAALECASDFYCEEDRCVERRESGDTCSSNDECESDQLCEFPEPDEDAEDEDEAEATSGECVSKLENGEACTDDSVCQSGWCECQVEPCEDNMRCTGKIVLGPQFRLCEDLR